MNIDEMVRRGRPESAGWARGEMGRRVLDGVVASDPAGDSSGRRVVGRSRASRPVLRWSFLGTGLVGAAAAGVLAVSVISAPQGARVGDPPPAGGQPGAVDSAIGGATPVTARDILLAAATRAEQAPAESGTYWHVKTLDVFGPQPVGAASGGYRLLRRTVNESWDASDPRKASWTGRRDFGVRPYSAADEQAWRAAGSPTEWALDTDSPKKLILSTRPGEGTLTRDSAAPRYLEDLGQLSLEQVRHLPDEQGALREWVTGRIKAEMGAAAGSAVSDQLLFGFLSRMLLDTPAPPEVRAAAFRILADVPGVRSLGTVRDESGRSGQGVEFRDDSATVRLIVDPSAHRLLGTKTSSTPKGSKVPAKESSTVVLVAEWSDAAPQAPTLPQE
ncbi:CU044_5270 family protein [Plantactinospora sp. S1510]|uniref:CU044_5270 family protein n=1 Tax=Plantactinospora alkalitolerans TaxID=2789879 RepID=A0ABS0GWR5_9ACTN|nr:CU044_5270 family protein [Plantactinospora alkalitolerans]MBF9130654.1 CU044_5270 family protein [Plantactinospora alkalitolerans]